MRNTDSSPLLVVLALIAVQILFGVNYIVSKIVVGAFHPLVWAFIRIAFSTVMMAGIAMISRRQHPPREKQFFVPMILFALLGCVINQASFLMGLKMTTPTNSAILNTLIPVFTLLIVTIRGQEPLTRMRIIGFVTALTGVLIIRKIEDFSFSDETAIGDLLTMVNCLSYALFLSYGRPFMQKYDVIWSTAWMFGYGSIAMFGLAIPGLLTMNWPEMTSALWGAAIFAVIGATLMPYFLNSWALARANSSQVAFYIYLQPVITSGIAWAISGEPPTMRTVLSCGVIFTGFFLATRKKAA